MSSMALAVTSILMSSILSFFLVLHPYPSFPFLPPCLRQCISSSRTTSISPLFYCARGDKKTAKGKWFNHSYGDARSRNKKKGRGPPRVPVPPTLPWKDQFDDGEVVKIEIDESLFSGGEI